MAEMTPKQTREAEVAAYESNIARYQAILATLPTEWPERLLAHRDAANQHEEIAKVQDLDDVELLSKLWYADQCKKFIRTETLEMTKAKAILATL
ncbi:MAG: hypothetical protein EBZ61_08270 [Micrococcales bacterium]|nr:hypothetical protein [Micrococcales bacterium]